MTGPDRSRTLLGVFFIFAGIMHFVRPAPYVGIMPVYIPAPELMVALSGVAEIIGGILVLVRSVDKWARIWLILMLIAIFPANVEMLRQYHQRGAAWWMQLGTWLRLPLQALLIWWVWRVTRPSNSERSRPS